MPLFRVHVTYSDLSVAKPLKTAEFPAAAKELVIKDLKAAGVTGYRIGKVKLVREGDPCCVCQV